MPETWTPATVALYGVAALAAAGALWAGGYAVAWRMTAKRCPSCRRRHKAWLATCPRCGFQSTTRVSRDAISAAPPAPAESRGVRRAFLALEQDGKSIHYPVRLLGNTYVGRSERNDIVLEDGGVSGSHCRVEHRPSGFMVFDLASTNGTFLNGRRVEKAPVEHGDRLRLGRTTLLFLVEHAAAS